MSYLRAVGIVAVIFITVYWYRGRDSRKWKNSPNISYVHGLAEINADSKDGTVKYLGQSANQGACQAQCASHPECTAYSWYADNELNWKHRGSCYGLPTIGEATEKQLIFSGSLVADQTV